MQLDDRDIEERFVRASGPGGQNVNKVATAVQLRYHLATADLPEDVKARLRRLAGRRLTADDVVVIDSRAHRTQGQNRDAARSRLEALVARAWERPKTRRATTPKAAAREARLKAKKRRATVKQQRGRTLSTDD